ncbi:hypothetical protein KAJ27_15610 [bacterium]|nr:hypothetical protein [bacterium]
MKLERIKNKLKRVLNIKEKLIKNDAGIKMILVFHMNQNQVPFAYLADDVCYEILLESLNELELPFVLNISGPLLKTLLYKKSRTPVLIKQMIEKGTCELISSSYAEDISIVTPLKIRMKSILMHKRMIENYFKIQVKGFWSSERVWSQELVDLALNCGFEYSFIENTILQSEPSLKKIISLPFCLNLNDKKFYVFPDIKEFKWGIDNFINSESLDFSELNRNIKHVVKESELENPLITFAEDAEMFRLWAMEKKTVADMDRDTENLDILFSSFKDNGYKFILPNEMISGESDIKIVNDINIPIGWANWMDVCCQETDRFFYETGYSDWKDFIERSPKISKFSEYFDKINNEIEDRKKMMNEIVLDKDIRQVGEKLLDLADLILSSHLYEFGCIGIGGDDFSQWIDANRVDFPLMAFDCLINGKPSGFDDQGDNILFWNAKFSGCISKSTGSIIHLFDLKRGISFRDYTTHYYGEKHCNNNAESVRLNRAGVLWDWLKDCENVPDKYSCFRLNNYVTKLNIIEEFKNIDVVFSPPKIDNNTILFQGKFFQGSITLIYRLEEDEIICDINIRKESQSQSVYLNIAALPDPLVFSEGCYDGFEYSESMIKNKATGSCLCFDIKSGDTVSGNSVLDSNSRKDFFSINHTLFFGNDNNIEIKYILYSL